MTTRKIAVLNGICSEHLGHPMKKRFLQSSIKLKPIAYAAGMALLFSGLSKLAHAQDGTAPPSNNIAWIIGSIIFVIGVIGGFLWYMHKLQDRFFEGCKEEKHMALFFESPAGLPAGTVRSVLALIIVTISLYFIVVGTFTGTGFPETLTTVLGTVIGFYFGARSSSKGSEQAQLDQVKAYQEDRDKAMTQHGDNLAGKIQKGIAMTKVAVDLLPDDLKKKYSGVIGKLENGLSSVKDLSKLGNAVQAVDKAKEVFDAFRKENPVKDIVKKASLSFATVLGGSVPPVAIIGAVVAVGTALAGVAYQKWKSRILHAPFSPADTPLKIVDANTGFTLFLKCPIFKKAFMPELEANNRPFIGDAVKDFLGPTEKTTLWNQYKDRFESMEEFEAGLDEFRRAAVDLEIKNEIPPELLTEVGGYENLVASIDKIHANPEAKADLDAVFMISQGLQQKGEPVKSIFKKVREDIES